MGVTNYKTVNGKIRGEKRSGEAHWRDYLTDAVGNVVATYQDGWQASGAVYNPYGTLWAGYNLSGSRFGWLGSWGYRQTGFVSASHYVRARHYGMNGASWTSVDPLFPKEAAYGYVRGRVTRMVDPSGKLSCAVPQDTKSSTDPCALGKEKAVDACIALLCSTAGALSLADTLKGIAKLKPSLKSLIDWLFQNLKENLKEPEPIPSDPFTTARECCRDAKKQRSLDDLYRIYDKDLLVAATIGYVCKGWATKDSVWRLCAIQHVSDDDPDECEKCCDKMRSDGVFGDRDHGLCQKDCRQTAARKGGGKS
ncbi:MAG: hypothetical protein KF743_01420 [Fimbriimonadaceae bacterium]|nr:hypothetical protein [Fimbriimonadaceae bacterium]